MHCVVSLLFQLCRLDNGSGKRKINSHPFTFKLLSISIGVNSHVLNSPQTFQNHLKNSKNILLVHEVVVKRHAASRKRKCSLAEKLVFSLLLKNESNQLSKTSCTSRKTKLHQKRLKFTCKCEACSKCISQTNIEVLVHKRWLQKPLQHHAKSRKRPKTYQSQMLFHHSAPNPELCTKKTLLSPNSSCHTKSCRNVAHVHRINGSLYFHTPFATISMQYSQESSRHTTQCKNMYPSHLKNHCEDLHTKSSLPSSCRCIENTCVR